MSAPIIRQAARPAAFSRRKPAQWPAVLLMLAVACAAASTAFAFATDTPVTPGASAEARALLAYCSRIHGTKIISGQQVGWWPKGGAPFELNYLSNATGKLPALIGMDLAPYTGPGALPATNHLLVEHAIDWFNRRHGLVMFCCHWRAPIGVPSVYVKNTTFDISRAVTDGTPEHAAVLRDLDAMAAQLTVLRDARVPVLWRPLHEANGRWFWWGAHGPEPFKKLWRLMFQDFTVRHHLNNLIWVFSPGAETDLAEWYPGDAYVDIIGQDRYPLDGNHGPAKDQFDELRALARGTKLVALGENGPVPDPDLLVRERAGWLFFATWSGSILTDKTTPAQLRAYFNNPYVLNLGDVPDLRHYPVEAPGPAVKLAFDGAPGDVAIGGVRRLPVNVAVEDQNGWTVRTGRFTVTLALAHGDGGDLSGLLRATTVNGVATFPEVRMDKAGAAYRLVARADGLRSGVSAPFAVGPGMGIEREWWTNLTGVTLAALSRLAEPPAGRQRLDRAFEVPVNHATDFGARYRGYLIPPLTGTYKFAIANESVSALWLSRDESPDDKIKIAEVTPRTPYCKWPHTHQAESGPVELKAGRRYYIEVLQRQPSGSTQLAVSWQLPNGADERPIPACRLMPLKSGLPKLQSKLANATQTP